MLGLHFSSPNHRHSNHQTIWSTIPRRVRWLCLLLPSSSSKPLLTRDDLCATAGYSTADKTSFGWTTARERWPVIIVSILLPAVPACCRHPLTRARPNQTQAIDDAYRSVSKATDSETANEGKKIVEELGNLKYEVQHDRQLTCVPASSVLVLSHHYTYKKLTMGPLRQPHTRRWPARCICI